MRWYRVKPLQKLCIILCGSDLTERYFFEEWQKVSYNPDTYNINYYKEYVGAIEIYTLNEKDERTYGIRLEEAFPKTVDAIPLGHGSNNTLNKVNVFVCISLLEKHCNRTTKGKS